MACSDEDRGRSRRPGAEDRGWLHRSGTRWPGGREVEWRHVWSAPDLGLKTGSFGLVIWGLKITAKVSWFGPQNQVGFGLLVAPQNRRREVSAGHASRSSSLLGVEASLASVYQSGLKTGGGATTGGAHGTITEVALETS
jgi:hypothetical protein